MSCHSLMVRIVDANALIYVIIRYYSKKIVFDLQHCSLIKFVLSLVQSGLNMLLLFRALPIYHKSTLPQ
jgi:uncharacterized membrane protein